MKEAAFALNLLLIFVFCDGSDLRGFTRHCIRLIPRNRGSFWSFSIKVFSSKRNLATKDAVGTYRVRRPDCRVPAAILCLRSSGSKFSMVRARLACIDTSS